MFGQFFPSGMVGAGRLGFGRRVFFFRFRSLGFLLDFGGRDAGLLEEQRGLGRGKLFALGSPGAEVEQADFFVLDVEELVLVVNDFVLVLNDLLQARVRVFSKSMPLSNKVNSSATMRKAPGSAVLGQAKRPRPSRRLAQTHTPLPSLWDRSHNGGYRNSEIMGTRSIGACDYKEQSAS
jgi:hypothetical protein